MEARLKTSLWLAALIRLCDAEAIPCVIARRGDGDAGAVLILHDRRDGTFEVLGREMDGAGRLAWRNLAGPGAVAEDPARAYIARRLARDPDLWLVEIEDRANRLPGLLPG